MLTTQLSPSQHGSWVYVRVLCFVLFVVVFFLILLGIFFRGVGVLKLPGQFNFVFI